ncbi:MAG: hypothetical protein MK108_03790 [Mariniblastus sp.]|nr:hypothetical protein [Mariniblastus sp.]
MKTKMALMAALVAVGFAHQSDAAIRGLTVDQMVNMTVESSNGYTFIDGWTAAPTYGDGVTMSGVAGASDNLGLRGFVFFELTPTDLADFKAGAADGDTYAMQAWNDDNNDPWIVGIWYQNTSGFAFRDQVLEDPDGVSSKLEVTLTNVSSITNLGVYFVNPGSQGDTYHISFAEVPEPGTMAIWTVLGGLGLVISRRRKS